jgi:hypothetical protein
VALPADKVAGKHHETVHTFARPLVALRNYWVRRDDVDYVRVQMLAEANGITEAIRSRDRLRPKHAA